ncbi:MAG: AarF/ABC1/UbiB kinase family protein [Syntrophomonadaceae bacterium]|nr:AarF/ABC1/UbiB kinase family protein [Syntrophomonadaceae bacterium]
MESRWKLKYIRRRREIVGILLQHGLGYVMYKMGWTKLVPLSQRYALNERSEHASLAVSMREALVELGPTFVKFGQVLSTRPDLMPPVYIEELEKLQDKVKPVPWSEIDQVLKKEMGDPDAIFDFFNIEPLAAASIGQVHRARLKTGEEVIVKIQRPGIESKVRNDLEIIKGLARISEARSAEAHRLGIVAIVEDYAKTMLRELDYEREARNTERVYKNFEKDSRVVIPKVYRRYSTPRVLIEEYIAGVKLSNLEVINRNGWDRGNLSKLGTEAFLSQIMLHGFFQADPHPGNILAVDENTIAFIDFGEIGYLTEHRLVYLGELLVSISKRDIYQSISVLHDMGIVGDLRSMEDFHEDFADLIERIAGATMGNIDMNRLRIEIMELSYRYHLIMPPYMTSLMKALITVEGLGKKLDPEFNFVEVAGPLATKAYKERIKPQNVARYLKSRYYQDIKPLSEMPGDFSRLLKDASEGKMVINMQIEPSEHLIRKMTQLESRLSMSLLLTGILVASAMIIQTNHTAAVEEYAWLGVAGFGLALISLIVFVFGSLRS